TVDSRDPSTGEVVGRCVDSGPEDIDKAVKAATEAFESWRRMPAPRRGEILFHVAERLVRDKETLARTVTREMGKVLAEAKGDVQEAIDMAYYMAAEGRRWCGQRAQRQPAPGWLWMRLCTTRGWRSRWAARPPFWSWKTPTWTWPWTGSPGAPSVRPASAARPAAGSLSTGR